MDDIMTTTDASLRSCARQTTPARSATTASTPFTYEATKLNPMPR
jgi:hypothetical protein